MAQNNLTANNLVYQFKQASIVLKLIIINAIIFLLVFLGSFFFKIPAGNMTAWLLLPTDFFSVLTQPWSLITYSFLHFGIWHIFWNMYILYLPFILEFKLNFKNFTRSSSLSKTNKEAKPSKKKPKYKFFRASGTKY